MSTSLTDGRRAGRRMFSKCGLPGVIVASFHYALYLFNFPILLFLFLDVGGGSVGNESRNNLARIPLRWMIRQCFKANTGIRFHSPLLAALRIDPNTLYPAVLTSPPPIYYTPPPPGPSTSNSPISIKKKLKDAAKTLVNVVEEAVDE